MCCCLPSMNIMVYFMDQFVPCLLMGPSRYIFFPILFFMNTCIYIFLMLLFSWYTAYTIPHFLWLHFFYHHSQAVLSIVLPMLISFSKISLFFEYVLILNLPYLPEYAMKMFSSFIIWKTGDHHLVIACEVQHVLYGYIPANWRL